MANKKTYISVNRHTILANHKHGREEPPVRIARGKHGKPQYGHRVIIHGNSTVVYDPQHPLKCGARLWIETGAEVEII